MSQPASRLCESSVADWAKIQALVLDVDGVLTDGTIFVGPDGFELKQFSILGTRMPEKTRRYASSYFRKDVTGNNVQNDGTQF